MATKNIDETEEVLPLQALTIGRRVRFFSAIMAEKNIEDITLFATKECGRRVELSVGKIGGYSTVNNEFVDNHSGLKYLHKPSHPIRLDLLNSFTSNRKGMTHSEENSLTYIGWCRQLKWISKHRQQLMATEDRLLDTDFICNHRVLHQIMALPYEDRYKSMAVLATKYRGNIYLYAKKIESNRGSKLSQKLEKVYFSGHRFAQYMTSGDPNTAPDLNSDFDPNTSGYTAIVKTQLKDSNDINGGNHSMIYYFGVDCIQSNMRLEVESLEDLVDLKTGYSGKIKKADERLKWWVDDILKGISTIYYSEKDHNYVVTDVKEMKVDTLPNGRDIFWSPKVCRNFLNTFLSHVKEVVTIDDPNVIYQFQCLSFDTNLNLKNKITCSRLSLPDELEVLPEWYINEFLA